MRLHRSQQPGGAAFSICPHAIPRNRRSRFPYNPWNCHTRHLLPENLDRPRVHKFAAQALLMLCSRASQTPLFAVPSRLSRRISTIVPSRYTARHPNIGLDPAGSGERASSTNSCGTFLRCFTRKGASLVGTNKVLLRSFAIEFRIQPISVRALIETASSWCYCAALARSSD